jgi:hypothetical protein
MNAGRRASLACVWYAVPNAVAYMKPLTSGSTTKRANQPAAVALNPVAMLFP